MSKMKNSAPLETEIFDSVTPPYHTWIVVEVAQGASKLMKKNSGFQEIGTFPTGKMLDSCVNLAYCDGNSQ